jgi:hypothetical protein
MGKIWAEYAMTTTYLSKPICAKTRGKRPSTLTYGGKTKLNSKCGEIRVVITKYEIQVK